MCSTGMMVDILDRNDTRQIECGGGLGRFAELSTRRSETAELATPIDQADVAVAEPHDVVAGLEFGDADEFADQSLADEDALAFPHDIARTTNPPDLLIGVALIVESSLPLKAVESDFAVDSSGFTTSRFIRWFDHKYGAVRQQHEWVKVHLMCGVRTNIVTAVEIRDKDASDTKLLPDLVNTTGKNFKLNEVSADKGYSSINNHDVIHSHGAVPYIAFKGNHTGAGGGLWQKMFHYFQYRREEFLGHYHKRSNVESTFSMIKAKFRDHVRSKTTVAMVNEVLCKIICHNICCLIQESHELGISAEFWENKTA